MKHRDHKKTWAHYMAIWGCIATGLVYAGIGVVAMLSFLKLKEGGADEGSLLVYMEDYLAGRIFIYLVLTGMLAYITWRFYETIKDPYNYGKSWKGLGRRAITAFTSLADLMIAYAAIQALFGFGNMVETGEPQAEREMVSGVLAGGNAWIIISIGIITCITALVQLGYVVQHGYVERLDMQHLDKWKQKLIHSLAWAGHIARGIILGIIGFFLVKAGFTGNAAVVVNTDKAFDFIGDHVGHLYFILVAIGTISYGAFMILLGIYFDPDADKLPDNDPKR